MSWSLSWSMAARLSRGAVGDAEVVEGAFYGVRDAGQIVGGGLAGDALGAAHRVAVVRVGARLPARRPGI
jgi:hypothetical protein